MGERAQPDVLIRPKFSSLLRLSRRYAYARIKRRNEIPHDG